MQATYHFQGNFLKQYFYYKPHLIPYLSYPLAPIVYIVTTSLILVLILGNYFREGNYIIPFFAFLSALAGFILYEIWKRIKITTDGHG